MAGNWMDDRERQLRERARREAGDDRGGPGGEDRSFGRDRVFGERESGASYGNAGGFSGGPSRGGPAARGWQSPDYQGVSPAMRQGGYGQAPRFNNGGDTGPNSHGGGRFYGDDSRERVYREEYGYGGADDARRGPAPEPDHAGGYGRPGYGADPGGFRPDFSHPASGGTGGYDYERGYGDAGRRDSRGDRFEDAGRGAGEFLHRAGEKVAAWFNAGGEGRVHDPDYLDPNRGKRGVGPQGYKRSDERISDDAHDRLTDDHWLDASDIAIAVSDGEVTLSGTVDSREAKHRAERLVEDLPGVTHVQNNLRRANGGGLSSPVASPGESVLGAQIRAADEDAGGALGDEKK